ncbi:MAG: hypothetical protein A3B99_05425 [Candidatus Yanofskybacteria bacterium RIFCSPHIGHO2_02_FULL_44_12b]|uniref:Transmembrane protein n=2 Tax=Candidatus Yanofskyibacteriota TaxID=1752733 RepID=A0A1F8GJ93_9BACT|nr:MAG: hypothetical protein UW79_C0028G0016 [Candidatus Yanofskybacteria bacterium GW2011_GWA2_44_9]OGN05147.1 MAG: hypothetical protein A2659_02315 [Candidatus Yanofskybacteria bacterium RIFCSPHIGHO2_01_FULL_44_24]OGN14582.1 MAG: hypothetical protein A3B99_05425 [Candidatus Yanofskybacteria bacterium RIFCSPHIGHO2_02_FULL_44_12b]OGN25475.1 MAG: hypothetical protein A2925_01960 [Candidatus Yanofskybacteria bacterium RIFCSPLOWO2_01_FULL_44_22]
MDFHWGLFILLTVCAFLSLVLSHVFQDEGKDGSAIGCFVLGIATFILVICSVGSDAKGSPITNMPPGEYVVKAVVVEQDRVDLLVEMKDHDGDHLVFCQVPLSGFDGKVNPAGKKLVVTKSGAYKKLKLE